MLLPLLIALTQAGVAQRADAPSAEPIRPPVERIADVRIDANGDGEPDRLGDTVTVAGRAVSGTNTLHRDYAFFFMQDASGGISLYAHEPTAHVATGDSVIVTGVVQQFDGLSQILVTGLALVAGPRRVPAPVVIDDPRGELEPYEGRLVELRGRIKGRDSTQHGVFALVGSESSLDGLQVFVSEGHSSPPDLASLRVGDEVTVRGLLAQHDVEPPFDAYYQIFPRSREDVRIEGFSGARVEAALRWGGALLLVALLWLLLMRLQVRRRTRQLDRTARHFEALIENAYEAIFVIDTDARVTFASRGIERILGWPMEQRVGGIAFDIVHPDDQERARRTFAELVATPGSRRVIEFRARHRDGSYRVLDSIAQNFLHDPATAAIVVNSRDVTERHALEQQLHRSRKLEAIGRVAGGVAHDFNNLMTVVRGHTELLMTGAHDEQAVMLGLCEIDEAAERAADLTGQLLAFSRKQVLRPQVVDVAALLRRMENLLRRLIGEDIRIELCIEPGVGNVSADPTQLEQVLMNLAVNARDAMPHGGTLSFGLANALCTERDATTAASDVPPGDYVVVTVRDSGSGIEPAILEHIFDPFFTTKQERGGTGLGLATVYGIVKQSGGHIDVETGAAGTTFRIHLPRTDVAAAARVERASPSPTTARGGTVLLVEDERALRMLTQRILERGGYHVLPASDGVEALDVLAAASTPPDLVLTDVVMPHMGGRELAEHITRQRPDARLLFVSGYPGDDLFQGGVICDGRQFLAKPFSPDQLLERVRALMPQPVEAPAG